MFNIPILIKLLIEACLLEGLYINLNNFYSQPKLYKISIAFKGIYMFLKMSTQKKKQRKT
jgi:hypothetical protein